jgi:phosphate transport system protein
MERHFHQDLQALQDKLSEMAARAETALTKSTEALKARDPNLAEEVVGEDLGIDRIELQIEGQCLNFLGLQQPVARDLRFLVAAIRIANYLERIGDHAVNIAQSASKLSNFPHVKPLDELARMAERTIAMLRDADSSWLNHNTLLAKQICERDSEIDALKTQIFTKLSSLMLQDREAVPRALELVLVSRNLERVADLATNIAEETIFVTEARVIKHHADAQTVDAANGSESGGR